MAEQRLIDANALKRDLIDNRAFYSVLMKNALDRQPTIDAVEVVRCKECIGKAHWYKNDYGFTICGLSGLFVLEDKDFCSYGERKVENARDFVPRKAD